jgi:glycine cleavage system aminomethyltransferase T
MGYVDASNAQEEKIVYVKIRNKTVRAKIKSFPFYDTEKYGYKRKLN